MCHSGIAPSEDCQLTKPVVADASFGRVTARNSEAKKQLTMTSRRQHSEKRDTGLSVDLVIHIRPAKSSLLVGYHGGDIFRS